LRITRKRNRRRVQKKITEKTSIRNAKKTKILKQNNWMTIKNIVAISDTHFGCKLALCPDKFQLDEGGYYTPSKLQKVVNSYWKQFWQWVAKSTKGEDFVVVHNGDSLDGIHHNSVTQITQNIDDQKRIAYGMMNPVLSNPKCKGYFHIRGTEAHAGKIRTG
jgi:hypothetical protein